MGLKADCEGQVRLQGPPCLLMSYWLPNRKSVRTKSSKAAKRTDEQQEGLARNLKAETFSLIDGQGCLQWYGFISLPCQVPHSWWLKLSN